MPRRGKNIRRTGSGRWEVQFKLKTTVVDDAGIETTKWLGRKKVFDSKADAEDFQAEVRLAASRGELWEDKREVAVPMLGALADTYVESIEHGPSGTYKFRRSMMNSWTSWAGRNKPASVLSVSMLEAYAQSLPSAGRAAGTRHRKVLEVERMWKWARRRPDLWPGVPEVVTITGTTEGIVRPPPPVIRTSVPTWADVDAMIAVIKPGWKYGDVHQRIALLLRYTGLRISQALTLRWDDVHIAGRNDPDGVGSYVVIRAGRRGSKSSGTRVIPLHTAMAEEMAGWGRREGFVFEPEGSGPYFRRGDSTRGAIISAWKASGVAVEKWDVSEAEARSGERAHGSPCHSIRACLKVGMLRAGVSDSLVDYFIGHSRGATNAAYVPESAPETSPYWQHIQVAVAAIPTFPVVAVARAASQLD